MHKTQWPLTSPTMNKNPRSALVLKITTLRPPKFTTVNAFSPKDVIHYIPSLLTAAILFQRRFVEVENMGTGGPRLIQIWIMRIPRIIQSFIETTSQSPQQLLFCMPSLNFLNSKEFALVLFVRIKQDPLVLVSTIFNQWRENLHQGISVLLRLLFDRIIYQLRLLIVCFQATLVRKIDVMSTLHLLLSVSANSGPRLIPICFNYSWFWLLRFVLCVGLFQVMWVFCGDWKYFFMEKGLNCAGFQYKWIPMSSLQGRR